MKANEAPERVYCESDGLGNIVKVHNIKWPDDEAENIEYTQTDAFIKKACKFISDRVDIPFNVECSNGEPLADSYIKYASSRLEAANKIIEDFKKYMKGE